jgi:hypothetical protein
VRIDKLYEIISSCRLGIHDLSRREARFNMPLELGIFLGAKRFGDDANAKKESLIVATERYEYQKYISDVAGQDIEAHNDDPRTMQRVVRDWLATHASDSLPTAATVWGRYGVFNLELEEACRRQRQRPDELTYRDFLAHVGTFCRSQHNVLTTSRGAKITNPSRHDIATAIRSLDGSVDSFAILEKGGLGLTYMQTSRNVRNGFVLEYQEGSTNRHYNAGGSPLSEHQVVTAFWGLFRGQLGLA